MATFSFTSDDGELDSASAVVEVRATNKKYNQPALRFSPQESVPVEGRDRRRWPSLQRVVRDFERGPSEQAPAKRHSALGRLTALTCRDASLARPWTANPGEKPQCPARHSLAATERGGQVRPE